MTPEEFPRAFALAFAERDTEALLTMLTADAQVVTLTGGVTENAKQAGQIFAQEFAGIFAAAKLVTGRCRLQVLAPNVTVVHQRYVVMGARDQAVRDMPRFVAALTAVMILTAEGWLVVSLSLSTLA